MGAILCYFELFWAPGLPSGSSLASLELLQTTLRRALGEARMPEGVRGTQEETRGVKRSHEEPGGWRSLEHPGGPQGGLRRRDEEPGGAKGIQGDPGVQEEQGGASKDFEAFEKIGTLESKRITTLSPSILSISSCAVLKFQLVPTSPSSSPQFLAYLDRF